MGGLSASQGSLQRAADGMTFPQSGGAKRKRESLKQRLQYFYNLVLERYAITSGIFPLPHWPIRAQCQRTRYQDERETACPPLGLVGLCVVPTPSPFLLKLLGRFYSDLWPKQPGIKQNSEIIAPDFYRQEREKKKSFPRNYGEANNTSQKQNTTTSSFIMVTLL